ncbi:hypothetical protein [Streptomyces sp. OK228]|uniref:hypothetical protein n=1 Tax=Streptomyces sp. OK228 TaxID=1882786 RepID=UPI000BD7DF35|nr:hypothetical protein [Streptomyces sp. OK228]SOE32588.1 hypothetical protein SAMN05442782_9555 [Streptomyces sp. OK228]
MILVHVSNTWPQVLEGQLDSEDATLGSWFNISDAAMDEYGDVVLGIYENTVVSAFDVTGQPHRDDEGRVTFPGRPSTKWSHLIGTPNPGKPWGVRGMARPIQYLHTTVLVSGTVEVEDDGTARRAVVDGFTLVVDHMGTAVLSVPVGCKVTILTRAA